MVDVQKYLGQIEKFNNLRHSITSKNKLLIDELKKIPHLKLDFEFNPETIVAEGRHANNLQRAQYSQERRHRDPGIQEQYDKAYRYQLLIDFTKDSTCPFTSTDMFKSGRVRFKEDGSLNYFVTDLGEKMPNTCALLNHVLGQPGRTRYSQLFAGENVPWHSHCQSPHGGVGLYNFAIVHFPLVSEPEVYYRVGSSPNPENDKLHSSHYAPGEVWVLNGYHYHGVANQSAKDRFSIVSYVSLNHPQIVRRLEQAVGKYEGPLISNDCAPHCLL